MLAQPLRAVAGDEATAKIDVLMLKRNAFSRILDTEEKHLGQSTELFAALRKCIAAIDEGRDHIVCWGTGKVSREFLYVDDAAEGILRATEVMNEPVPINLGTGMEITIKDLVELIARLTGFRGEIRWDSSKPDGQPRRCLDTQRAKKLLNWQAQVGFEEGLRRTIQWWRSETAKGRAVQTSTR